MIIEGENMMNMSPKEQNPFKLSGKGTSMGRNSGESLFIEQTTKGETG